VPCVLQQEIEEAVENVRSKVGELMSQYETMRGDFQSVSALLKQAEVRLLILR